MLSFHNVTHPPLSDHDKVAARTHPSVMLTRDVGPHPVSKMGPERRLPIQQRRLDLLCAYIPTALDGMGSWFHLNLLHFALDRSSIDGLSHPIWPDPPKQDGHCRPINPAPSCGLVFFVLLLPRKDTYEAFPRAQLTPLQTHDFVCLFVCASVADAPCTTSLRLFIDFLTELQAQTITGGSCFFVRSTFQPNKTEISDRT